MMLDGGNMALDAADLAYVETKESVIAELRAVEARLALLPNLRESLRELERQGVQVTPDIVHKVVCNASLLRRYPFNVENDLAMEWYSAYAAWSDWKSEESKP